MPKARGWRAKTMCKSFIWGNGSLYSESFRSTADRGEPLFLQILCLANSYTDFKEEYMLNILLGAIQWPINY